MAAGVKCSTLLRDQSDKKAKKPLTAQEQMDMDIMAESELARLQRQYRIMEGDRTAFSEETGSKLSKQRNVIKTLKREQNDLLKNLNVAASEGQKKKDAQILKKLQDLLEEHDQFCEDVKTEKQHLNEIEYQIRKIEKQLQELRGKQLTDDQWQTRVLAGQRTVEALENKLEVAIKRFCAILAENRKMREEIDHLLKERFHFNEIWEKLIVRLNQGKKFMLDLIEQATIAYDQREEWCSKLQALRLRAHSDLVSHTQEMRELEREIDHDSKLQEFLAVKAQRRVMKDLEDKELRKRMKAKEDMDRLLREYRETLDKIKEFCGEDDIDRLEAMFIKQEEENFALFNYVNELNHELEGMSESIAELRKNIDEQREINNARAQKQADTLESLKNKLELTKIETAQEEERLKSTEKDLSQLLDGIDSLFQLVKCDKAPILNLLGDHTSINNFNALLYLGLLEQRVTELVSSCYYKDQYHIKTKSKKSLAIKIQKDKCKLQTVEELAPKNPCPLCVEQEMVTDIIDNLQYVQTRNQVEDSLERRHHLPGILDRLHNVSTCFLPKSREIIQRRYQ